MPTSSIPHPSAQPTKVLIIVEGGCIQAVQSSDLNTQITIIDYDTDGSDEHARQIAPKEWARVYSAYVEPITLKV